MNELSLPAEILTYKIHGIPVATALLLLHTVASAFGRILTAARAGGGINSMCLSIWAGSSTTGVPIQPKLSSPSSTAAVVTAILFSLILPAMLLTSACSTPKLELGGAYAPMDTNGVATAQADPIFFEVDSAYYLAYSTIDGAMTFERQNRAALWAIAPTIKHTLDSIRPQVWAGAVEYSKARQAYLANPLAANLSTLQSVLGRVQQLMAVATAVMPGKSNAAPIMALPVN
jgi:hypothetical protein